MRFTNVIGSYVYNISEDNFDWISPESIKILLHKATFTKSLPPLCKEDQRKLYLYWLINTLYGEKYRATPVNY